MSKYTDLALERRKRFTPEGRPVYNCCQATVSVFTEEESALRAAAFFGGGMRMGSVCGAITGGLMALGQAGLSDPAVASEFIRKVKENHGGMVNCRDLLAASAARGEEKMAHCNGLICECVGYVEEILRAHGKIE